MVRSDIRNKIILMHPELGAFRTFVFDFNSDGKKQYVDLDITTDLFNVPTFTDIEECENMINKLLKLATPKCAELVHALKPMYVKFTAEVYGSDGQRLQR